MSCGLYLSQWGASGSESCWLVGLLGGSMSRWDSDEEIPLQKYKHCIDNCWKKIFSSLSENIEQHLIFLTFLINSDYFWLCTKIPDTNNAFTWYDYDGGNHCPSLVRHEREPAGREIGWWHCAVPHSSGYNSQQVLLFHSVSFVVRGWHGKRF